MNPSLTPSAPVAPTTGSLTSSRLAGAAGLTFAAGVLIANMSLFGLPMADAPAAEAAAWLDANRLRAMIGTGMVGITFPALLVFGAAMFDLARENGASRRWMLVGALGGTTMVGIFGILVVGMIASLHLLETGGEAFAVAWAIHNGAFAVNVIALGTAFLGFALGAYAAGVGSRGLRNAGLVGAGLLLFTGLSAAAVAGGSPLGFAGFAGFLLWLTWLVTISIRLLQKRS